MTWLIDEPPPDAILEELVADILFTKDVFYAEPIAHTVDFVIGGSSTVDAVRSCALGAEK